MLPSLNGRRFQPVDDVVGGDVGPGTVFDYHESGGVIHAEFSGATIVRGALVGTREGDELEFRYVQLRTDGTTAAGHCRSVISEHLDGRLRLDETWEWESSAGSGTSVLIEVLDSESLDELDPEDVSLLDLLR